MYSIISKILDVILVKMAKSLYVIGKENIPKDSKYVVTCTHESYNEVIMLGMALLPNQIHYMAKKELFSNKWGGKFLSSLNAFPVDRENPGPSTLKRPINLLKEHKTVGIFPTGHRTSMEGAPLKRGAATIAMLGKAPILPAAYVGPKKIHGLITGQAMIKIGEPIDTTDIPKDLKRNEKVEYLTKEIEKRTNQLQKELNEIAKRLED
ncbi:lysophospholipid acyltransferase family protein [Staphylococcus capitis]|jgi:1-acyl-sn-glycerol-3-phosphate acyltransferase|uniref:1-acyl-sn-glycerol-3-phosphate acyltransferase n=1 Tax=Staphylococcus capitis TaxID=29388 RepID=A0A7Z7YY66_STACP|nr:MULTISPECIES: 1-acyl-sn-glycerol-3-phosphate acyltransferase [Staphylococcus]MBW4835622.1 1-acyl-sn-glycerol-3-phosphate acyltransferase [Staphylococcaceae bacterium]ATN02559.1 1-acyl-sn-glycerol-3-phosphate acyltransferase [Staphylococcus capitis]MBC3079160.1 1-acyl-sn-glycerol-3-phosphate acyltransferase [Staphylococcus capitis]MBC8780048.1 1-acyl-sn-glycerol-3-phosphate acyltransferase [Staphylococcus capitis]MBE7321645.1 1-acyl-sn-glycerol-3-phosphate acyltransferase [Staphylococcus cap